MRIEIISISSLVFDPANARKHSEKNLKAIKGSLSKFGQQKPIVIGKDNTVIAGNGTLEAAKALGWEKIKVVRTDLKGKDATAFAIADNRTGELAGWDFEVLGSALASLKADDFDIGEIGFDLDDWNLMAPQVDDGADVGADDDDDGEDDDESPKAAKAAAHIIVVTLPDAEAKIELFQELRDRGFKVKS
jgi:hypothetical protein